MKRVPLAPSAICVGEEVDVGRAGRPRRRAVEEDAGARGAEHVAHVRVVAVRDDRAVRGHERDAGAERGLHRVEVGVEVRVVELDRREDERPRRVVEELRPLVRVGRRVLVALDDERRPAAERGGAREVRGLAADEVSGVAARRGEEPREERGRRRLAVRAGDDDGVPAREDLVVERLGHRRDGEAAAQGLEDLGVVLAGQVARDDVGRRRRRRSPRAKAGRTSIPSAASRSDIGG